MSYTYDLTTDVGRVRLMIPDRIEAEHVFEDEELEAFLALEGTIKAATALALETIASDHAMVLKVVRLLDLQTDGARVSDALLKRAAQLRAQNEAENVDGLFDWAEMTVNDFAARERLWKEALRDG